MVEKCSSYSKNDSFEAPSEMTTGCYEARFFSVACKCPGGPGHY